MIRELTLQELDQVKELFLDVFTHEPWEDEWESDEQVTAYMTDLMANKNSLSLGFFEHEQLTGLALGYLFHWWQGDEYFIKEFCISRDLQGQGLGTAFLMEMERFLKEKKISAVWLATERPVPAYSFYLKNGFQEQTETVFLSKSIK